jgi:hypothetical protein
MGRGEGRGFTYSTSQARFTARHQLVPSTHKRKQEIQLWKLSHPSCRNEYVLFIIIIIIQRKCFRWCSEIQMMFFFTFDIWWALLLVPLQYRYYQMDSCRLLLVNLFTYKPHSASCMKWLHPMLSRILFLSVLFSLLTTSPRRDVLQFWRFACQG